MAIVSAQRAYAPGAGTGSFLDRRTQARRLDQLAAQSGVLETRPAARRFDPTGYRAESRSGAAAFPPRRVAIDRQTDARVVRPACGRCARNSDRCRSDARLGISVVQSIAARAASRCGAAMVRNPAISGARFRRRFIATICAAWFIGAMPVRRPVRCRASNKLWFKQGLRRTRSIPAPLAKTARADGFRLQNRHAARSERQRRRVFRDHECRQQNTRANGGDDPAGSGEAGNRLNIVTLDFPSLIERITRYAQL